MPPRRLPKKKLQALRRRWRQLVDWSFDGNLTMAAAVLGMPFSTVQQYYQKGPRRISTAVVKRIDDVTGVGAWVAGHEPSEGGDTASGTLVEASGLESIPGQIRTYIIPVFLRWRIDRVVEEMGRRIDVPRDERIDVIFAPIVKGIEIGLLRNSSESELLSFAPALDAGGRVVEGVALVISLFDRDRVRQVHKFCKIWEDELGISAGPSKRPVRKKRSVKKFKSTRGTCSNGNRKLELTPFRGHLPFEANRAPNAAGTLGDGKDARNSG